MAFLFLSSLLAGLSAVIAVVCGTSGNEVVQTALSCSALASYYVGAAYYMHLFAGTVALVAAFERRWNMTVPLYAFSIGATASAGFLFSPFLQTTIFLSAEILILVYVFVYSLKVLPPTAEFKFLAVFSMAFSLGGLMAMAFEPTRAMEHVDALLNLDFIPESFAVVRDALSGVAIRSWFKNLWIGIGLGSFPIAFRFTATPEDLVVVRAGAEAVPNGWLMILSEGGVVAALMVVLPYGFLFYTWVRRLVGWVMTRTFCHPACCCGLLILPVVAVSGLYGCSFLRADVMIVTWALFSVSASAFPRKMRKDHGR